MDKVFAGFLERQLEEGTALAARSDLLTLLPVGGTPPDRYVARFMCRGLVRAPGGGVVEAEGFDVGINFHSDHLRSVNPLDVVTWLAPREIFHPNIGIGTGGRVFICIGHLRPGMPLVDILTQLHEIIAYQKVTMREDDALDREACAWTRANQHRLPIDGRTILGKAITTRDASSPSEGRP